MPHFVCYSDALGHSAGVCVHILEFGAGTYPAIYPGMNEIMIYRDEAGEWFTRLTDLNEIALMGTEWIPLPFTSAATREEITTFYTMCGQRTYFACADGSF